MYNANIVNRLTSLIAVNTSLITAQMPQAAVSCSNEVLGQLAELNRRALSYQRGQVQAIANRAVARRQRINRINVLRSKVSQHNVVTIDISEEPKPAPPPKPQAKPQWPAPQPEPQTEPQLPPPQPEPQAQPQLPAPQPEPQAEPQLPPPQPEPQAEPQLPAPQPDETESKQQPCPVHRSEDIKLSRRAVPDNEEHTRVIGSFVIIPKEEKAKADLKTDVKKEEKPRPTKKEQKPGQVSVEAADDEKQVSQQGTEERKPVPPSKPQLRSPPKPQRVTHAEPQRRPPQPNQQLQQQNTEGKSK